MKQNDGPVHNLRLRHERELKHWSQEELAERIGTTAINVSRWERGVTSPGRYYRAKLCELFGKTADELGLTPSGAGTEDDEDEGAYPYWFMQDSQAHLPKPTFVPADSTARQLNEPANRLIGRDKILTQLKAQLCGGQALAALAGLPGVGKTALAAALVRDADVLQRFSDGVLWAGLGPKPDVLWLLGAWGAALKLTPAELGRLKGVEDRARAIRSVMGSRRMLLVVDDAWDAEPALAFKVGNPYCGFLVTTRSSAVATRIAGSATMVVPELSEQDGLALLERLAPEVAKSEPAAARALVESVGGLPLALTLMGSFLRVQAHSGQPRRVYAALERLKHTTERLRLQEPTAPGERTTSLPANKPLSLQAVVEVSDQVLTGPAHAALRALSVFPAKPNSFSEEAALAVTDASPDTLDALSDAGLVESSGPGRYALHRTIADYARHTLADRAPSDRLVRYFVPFVEGHVTDYAALDLESRNILAALDVAFERGIDQALVRMALAMAPYLKARGLYDVAETQLGRAERIARTMGDGSRRARIVMQLGRVADLRGDPPRADRWYADALDMARASGDREAACAILTYWGEALLKHDNYIRAETALREGLALARELGHRQRMAVLLRLSGELADTHGDFAQGEALSSEGLALAQEIGDWETASALLQNQGVRAERQGNYERANELYTEGLALARKIGHRQRISGLLMNLGVLALRRHQYDEARALHLESLELARLIGDRGRTSQVLQNLGSIAREQGHFPEAESYLRESLEMARELNYPWMVSETLTEWGDLLLQQGDLAGALARYQEAHAIARDVTGAELIAMTLYGLARVAAAQGDFAKARTLGEQSRQQYARMGHVRAREVAQWLGALPDAQSAS